MAERRMFTNKITESDAFLEMPLSSQALYFHLCMSADDDGFVKNPRMLCRMIGASEDDYKILIAKSFVMQYENGVIVIKHWRMHNLLRKDRYKPTEYIEEKSLLYIKENGAYTFDESKGKQLTATKWQPNGNQMAPQVRLGKDRIGKVNKKDNATHYSSEPKAAPKQSAPLPDAEVFLTMPLAGAEEYQVSKKDVIRYAELFPGVDIEQQLRNMTAWLESNPTRRKTKKGIKRFITSWLTKEQDRGGRVGGKNEQTQDHNALIAKYDGLA